MPPLAAAPRTLEVLEGAMSSFVWKLAVSVAIFAFIFSRVDIDAVGRTIGNADTAYLGLAILLSLVMVVTDGLLWKSGLQSLGHHISHSAALLYSIVGMLLRAH